MKNIVGQIAAKEDFYPRKRELRRITRILEAGGHMQLSAPRRVGKSSILVYLKDNPLEGFHFVYVDVESARDPQTYYRKIYLSILSSGLLTAKKKIWEQIKNGTNKILSRLKNINLGGVGEIELNENTQVDYEEELATFLTGIDLEGTKLVILVDEFPEVILNIVEEHAGDLKAARHFLQSNRTLRNHDSLRGRILFVYTGSSSLNATAEFLNSSELINDITAIPVNPLTKEEAADLVTKVLEEYNYKISQESLEYLLTKVEWLIPFYLQLMIHEIINLIDESEDIPPTVVDTALKEISTKRNDHHFEHYTKRLSRIFSEKQYEFIKKVLSELCKSDTLTGDQIQNIAFEFIGQDESRKVLESLISDGYINKINNDPAEYKFNSSILKTWWYNHEH